MDVVFNETEENFYDVILFLQFKLVFKVENILYVLCKLKGDILKIEIKLNKGINIEIIKILFVGSVNNCDKNFNILSELKEKDVINVEFKSFFKKGEFLKKFFIRKLVEKSFFFGEKILDFLKRFKFLFVLKFVFK